MSGRNSRGPARYTGAPRRQQSGVRRPTQRNPGYQMAPYQNPARYQMGPSRMQMPAYQQAPYQVINNYQIINYQRAGYQSREHAWQCPHVQRAISHHGIFDSGSLDVFLSRLARGCSILASLTCIGIFGCC